jgi:hypothetical protein
VAEVNLLSRRLGASTHTANKHGEQIIRQLICSFNQSLQTWKCPSSRSNRTEMGVLDEIPDELIELILLQLSAKDVLASAAVRFQFNIYLDCTNMFENRHVAG